MRRHKSVPTILTETVGPAHVDNSFIFYFALHTFPMHSFWWNEELKGKLNISWLLDIYIAEFWKHTSKWARIFAQKPGYHQVSGHYGEKKRRGLAVLVGLIVKISPWANSPWVGKRLPCQSLGGGGGCCKSVVPSVSPALGESVHWSCLPLVCHVKFL